MPNRCDELMPTGDYVLDVDDLSITFGDPRVAEPTVRGVSFRVPRGRTVGIVGESGAGKSAACLAAVGLSPPAAHITARRIDLLGQDVRSLSAAQLRRTRGRDVGMIFQEPATSLDPLFRIGDQIIEAIRVHERTSTNAARVRAVKLLDEVGIRDPEEAARRYPHQLSGGQIQRVMIAIALSCDPSILIADEPTTALDVTLQQQVLELICQLRDDRAMSIVFISHDLDVIGSIADEVLVMYDGSVVETGVRDQVITNPQHPYTEALFACRPRLDAPVERLRTVSEFVGAEGPDVPSGPAPSAPLSRSRSRREPTQPNPDVTGVGEAAGPLTTHHARHESPLVTVSALRVEYRQRTGRRSKHLAVDDVSFEIYQGDTFGIVGESGSGKSTTARAIEKLVDVSGGDILVDGQSILRLKGKSLKDHRHKVQMVFQDPYGSLNPHMSVGDTLTEPMRVHATTASKDADAAAISLLDDVGLDRSSLHRYPHQFSGGERQRICIARALAVDPDILICDESVSALDVSVQAQVLNLLKELQKQRDLTYIFISHDMSVVRHMCNRIAVMKDGALVEVGETDAILNAPQHSYTKGLIQAVRSTSAVSR